MVIRQTSQEGKKKSLKDGFREDEAYFGSGKIQEKGRMPRSAAWETETKHEEKEMSF